MVRESTSTHSSPTFCVRKPNGKWRLAYAYNKLNSATVPVQTPIPRKDVLLNNMTGCTLYSALDLVDAYYQILMGESDIPLTAVSTPSGMLWEWLVMPQGLSNAPVTFNRLVTQLFRPLRAFVQTYFDDIFVHSRVENGQTAMEVHLGHLRRVFVVMGANKLYANIDKCVFGAEGIKVLGCLVSSAGVRADPEKAKAIAAWPTPMSQKDLRKWLGLATYLHKYSDPRFTAAFWKTLFRLLGTKLSMSTADHPQTRMAECDQSDTLGCPAEAGAIMKEQREVAARAMVSTPSNPHMESLKLHMNSYVGREGEPLLRWFVEVDTAITARRIVDPLSKVVFAMSCLGGRARSLAYGRRLTDPTCFSTYEVFRQAFEPSQNEFRSRAELLDPQQGKHDVHAYAQRARYLVSSIVTNPIDEATKVVTHMKGLRDGPDLSLTRVPKLDFEEVELPRSLLEVRLATGVVVRPEKRVVRAHFSYEEKKFVDELIVLDLDDKFDMVLGIPWLARHDPVINWAKHTIVHFRSSDATESDGPVGAAHAPRRAYEPPAEAARGAAASDLSARTLTTERVVREKCEPNQKTQTQSDLRGSPSVKRDAVVSTVVDSQEQEWPVTEGSDQGASAPGADAIGPNINGRSAVRRRRKRGASAPGADVANSAGGCKRPAPKMLACSRAAGLHDEAVRNQAGLDCVRLLCDPACDQKKYLSTVTPNRT
ncbi:unnamed protein product [Phytophthora fragariaefolia]|uniref:Unnamed protein product n=1 Tax=Phytophthora fragariaefolia TaxID=1490495 RepID=A0A9W6WRP7_9STRA|nr:unnamed protein product [Phytophthora fragariaefolia]